GDTIPVTFEVACVRTQRIAFASAYFAGIFAMRANGADAARLISSTTPATYGHPAWSPDGTKIAFHSDRDGNFEIYVMNSDGSGVTRLTNNYDSDWQPAWSPDGSRIAFTKNVYGCDDYDCWDFTSIYVINADGSGLTQLIGTNTGLDSDPAWRP